MDIKVKKKKIKFSAEKILKIFIFFLKQSLKENLYPLSLKQMFSIWKLNSNTKRVGWDGEGLKSFGILICYLWMSVWYVFVL